MLTSFIVSVQPLFSQIITPADSVEYILPVDIKTVLVASFGELRTNHFHAGIDIKTEHVTGKNLLAIADGYVSRIRRSPQGYGNVLYVTHPKDNIVAVYAHMKSFSSRIDSVLFEYQFEVKSNTIDFTDVPKDLLPVSRGEIIGLSGNSGSSTGPHLHFEIRDAITEHALNPLAFFPQLTEKARPRVFGLAVTPIGENSRVNGSSRTFKFRALYVGNGVYKASTPLTIKGAAGLSITTRDYVTASPHRFGIYSADLYVDGELMHRHTMDEIPFHETRFLNCLIDHDYKYRTGVYYERLYLEPNNRLSIYEEGKNNGVILANDSASHSAEINVADFYGNKSKVLLNLNYLAQDSIEYDSLKLNHYWKEVTLQTDEYYLHIPKGSLYSNEKIIVEEYKYRPSRAVSKAYSFHDPHTPSHFLITAGVKADSSLLKDKEGLVLCRLSRGGRTIYEGGYWRGDYLCADSKYFGTFFIARDNVPPSVRPLYFRNNSDLQYRSSMRIRVADNLSGINQYNAFIDGNWTPVVYDRKYGVMEIEFLDRVAPKDGHRHILRLVLVDNAGNKKEYTIRYYR